MPTNCPIVFPIVSEEDMRNIDYGVMGQVFAVHNKIGRLADESVYQSHLACLLHKAGIENLLEIPVSLSFRDFSLRFSLDMVVEQSVVYELKTVTRLTSDHEAQLLNYLYLTNSTGGKLVNFRTESVTYRFVNTSLDRKTRQRFEFDCESFSGDPNLVEMVRELVGDWGTGYSPSYYRRAILACTPGAPQFETLLPMRVDGVSVGKQRFYLLSSETGLGVTAYPEPKRAHRTEFEKLI